MSIAPNSDDMEVRHAAAAGLDVHKMQITATVRTRSERGSLHVETREFSALASGLALLVQWLLSLRVTGAVMEATGVYWEKAYDVLSHAGLDVMVVQAQHVKQIKGRKTDIADSVWLSRICQFGLASPSLVLPKTFRDLREPVSPHADRTASAEAASHPEGSGPERHPHRRHPQPGHS